MVLVKLRVVQLVKKFPTFYAAQRFMALSATAHQAHLHMHFSSTIHFSIILGLYVLTVASLNIRVLWDVTTCQSNSCRRFDGS